MTSTSDVDVAEAFDTDAVSEADIDPADNTVEAVKGWVREHEDDDDVDDVFLYALERVERAGNDRVTLTEWLAERHDYDPDPDAVTADTDAPADDTRPAREGPARERDDDQPLPGDDDYDPNVHSAFAPGEVPSRDALATIVVAPPHEGMFAGYFFEGGQQKVVVRNRRVDTAIVDGPLEYRGTAPDGATDGETV